MEIEDLAVPLGSRLSPAASDTLHHRGLRSRPRSRSASAASVPPPSPPPSTTNSNSSGDVRPASTAGAANREEGEEEGDEEVAVEMFQLCLNCTCELSRPEPQEISQKYTSVGNEKGNGRGSNTALLPLVPCDTCDCPASGKTPHHLCGGGSLHVSDSDRVQTDDAALAIEVEQCNACPHCRDTCMLRSCPSCDRKRSAIAEAQAGKKCRVPKFTMCQVRRHTK